MSYNQSTHRTQPNHARKSRQADSQVSSGFVPGTQVPTGQVPAGQVPAGQQTISQLQAGAGAKIETRRTARVLAHNSNVQRKRTKQHVRVLNEAKNMHVSADKLSRLTGRARRDIMQMAAYSREHTAADTMPKAPVPLYKKLIVIVCSIVSLCVVAAIIWIASIALEPDEPQERLTPEAETQQAQSDENIIYHGLTYYIEQGSDGVYTLMSAPKKGSQDATPLCKLSGTPVQMLLYNGALVIPENKSDGTWDIIAYTMGLGAEPTQVTDKDGAALVKQGSISRVKLEGASLHVVDDAGKETTVMLG